MTATQFYKKTEFSKEYKLQMIQGGDRLLAYGLRLESENMLLANFISTRQDIVQREDFVHFASHIAFILSDQKSIDVYKLLCQELRTKYSSIALLYELISGLHDVVVDREQKKEEREKYTHLEKQKEELKTYEAKEKESQRIVLEDLLSQL